MNERATNDDARADITSSTSYSVLCNLVIHAEQIRWARLNNFLIANSIFVLAWAAVFASDAIGFPIKQIALTWICLPGLIAGLPWAALGWRSSNYLDRFHRLAEPMEEPLPEGYPKPFTASERERAKARRQCVTSSRFIVTWVPIGFSLFYMGLIALSWVAAI